MSQSVNRLTWQHKSKIYLPYSTTCIATYHTCALYFTKFANFYVIKLIINGAKVLDWWKKKQPKNGGLNKKEIKSDVYVWDKQNKMKVEEGYIKLHKTAAWLIYLKKRWGRWDELYSQLGCRRQYQSGCYTSEIKTSKQWRSMDGSGTTRRSIQGKNVGMFPTNYHCHMVATVNVQLSNQSSTV